MSLPYLINHKHFPKGSVKGQQTLIYGLMAEEKRIEPVK